MNLLVENGEALEFTVVCLEERESSYVESIRRTATCEITNISKRWVQPAQRRLRRLTTTPKRKNQKPVKAKQGQTTANVCMWKKSWIHRQHEKSEGGRGRGEVEDARQQQFMRSTIKPQPADEERRK